MCIYIPNIKKLINILKEKDCCGYLWYVEKWKTTNLFLIGLYFTNCPTLNCIDFPFLYCNNKTMSLLLRKMFTQLVNIIIILKMFTQTLRMEPSCLMCIYIYIYIFNVKIGWLVRPKNLSHHALFPRLNFCPLWPRIFHIYIMYI